MQKDGIENSRNGSVAAPPNHLATTVPHTLPGCHVCRNQTFTTLSDVHTSKNSCVGPDGGRAGKPHWLLLLVVVNVDQRAILHRSGIVLTSEFWPTRKYLKSRQIDTPTGKKLVRCSHVREKDICLRWMVRTVLRTHWIPYIHVDLYVRTDTARQKNTMVLRGTTIHDLWFCITSSYIIILFLRQSLHMQIKSHHGCRQVRMIGWVWGNYRRVYALGLSMGK